MVAAATALWRPSDARVQRAALTTLREKINADYGLNLPDYAALHAFSVSQQSAFWQVMWDELGIKGEAGETAFQPAKPGEHPLRGARYFPQARLNIAETLLARNDATPALLFHREDGAEAQLSWHDLHAQVSQAQQLLKAAGVGPGDRVAFMLPNAPAAIVVLLAAASLGAVVSSCSPDFGDKGVLDRFGQIAPKIFIAVDGYVYGGKQFDTRQKAQRVLAGLPSLSQAFMLRFVGDALAPGFTDWDAALKAYPPGPIEFTPLPFDAPLYVLFSSGTTGKPKCIVHRAGVVLKQLVEHRYHYDLGQGDRLFFFTTCGWMMWNWLVAGLGLGATLLLYDGSPFAPDPGVLWRLAARHRLRFFGVSAKYFEALAKTEFRIEKAEDLAALDTIGVTGSPLVHESFDYIYQQIKADVCLASLSGGTDIVGCFVGGVPTQPVYRGQIQGPILGMKVEVLREDGSRAAVGEKGELVNSAAFPSQPLGFWGDADAQRYHAAYFARYPGLWHHGDFVEATAQGGYIIHGRSDATLNPGGVRIGTAEIYRQIEAFNAVQEALVCAQDWQGDTRILLFVRLAEGLVLDEGLETALRTAIRNGASPRHVPAKIVAVPDIPRTRSGKIVELAVREVIHGRPVKNRDALANPEALEHFRGLAALEQ